MGSLQPLTLPVDRSWPEHAQRTPPADMRIWNTITVTNGCPSRVSEYVNTMRHTIGSDVEITVFGGVWARGNHLTGLNAGITTVDLEEQRMLQTLELGHEVKRPDLDSKVVR